MNEVIKRYYTFEDMIDNPDNRIGDRIGLLSNFVRERNVGFYMNMPCFREELERIGVVLLNKEACVHYLVYPYGSNSVVDKIEKEIKAYAKTISIIIHDVSANLNYETICNKVYDGMLYLNEDIVIPNGASVTESIVYPYIDNLCADKKTLVITDPYLYMCSDSSYIDLVKKLFKHSNANCIKSVMPQNCRNSVYRLIENDIDGVSYSFSPYSDCHDRFWICPETQKGFCMGTSLNGLGSKICRLDMLREDEVQLIICELGL